MPVKKVIEIPQSEVPNTIVFDETHTFGDSDIRFVMDMAFLQEDVKDFIIRLKKARKIKGEADFISLSYTDPSVQVAEKNLEEIEDDSERMSMAIEIAKDHYMQLLEDAGTDAFLLAVTMQNEFSTDPIPYPVETPRFRPGLGESMPNPERILRFSSEKRLKQILDILFNDIEKWQNLRQHIIVQFSLVQKKYGVSRLDGSTF